MAKKPPEPAKSELTRLSRALTLSAQVEQLLRQAIAEGRFANGQLPTEVELAEQLGVSRETVRLAAGVLQEEGLLVKIRRKGTFLQSPVSLEFKSPDLSTVAFLQASYGMGPDAQEAVTDSMNALMLQGAVAEAGAAGWELLVRNAPNTQMRTAFRQVKQKAALRGVIFASFGEEKLLRQITGLGIPTVLVDHDVHLPQISSVREDSFEAARQAVRHLVELGHRRIAIAHWQHTDLNPWRLEGFRQGLKDAGLVRKRPWELSVKLTERGARQAAEQWLELSPRPTALYCFNNTLAKRVIDCLQERGLRIPEDVSVIGGGGEEVVGLTCHQADWHQIGRMAIQVLSRLMSSPKQEPEHLLSPHTLRLGNTTVAPSA
jgi:LacI family transcriptional regulator